MKISKKDIDPNDKITKEIDVTVIERKATKPLNEVRIVGSGERVDRDGEAILLGAYDFRNFEKHPVFLANHENNVSNVIGKVTGWGNTENFQKYFDIKVLTNEGNWLADWVGVLVEHGLLAVSISYYRKETEWDQNTDVFRDYMVRHQGSPTPDFLTTKLEFLELSAVGLPAYPDAVQMMQDMIDPTAVLTDTEKRVKCLADEIVRKMRENPDNNVLAPNVNDKVLGIDDVIKQMFTMKESGTSDPFQNLLKGGI